VMHVLCRLMGVMVLLAATSRVAAAAPVIFTDEAAFNAALAAAGLTTKTESFEGVDPGVHGELDFGGFAAEPLFLNFVTDEVASDGTNSLVVLALQFMPVFVFDGPIHAFSMDVIGALDRNKFDDLIFSVDDRPDVLLDGPLPIGQPQFVGFIDLVIPFTKVTFFSSDFVDDFAIDRVRYEDVNATPVPEPASLTLLAAGLLGTAARLRSRIRRDE
jgi:hypothetical protein